MLQKPSATAAPEVAVVVINWHSVDWLRRCLVALHRNTALPFETIVADNASYDGSAAMLAADFPRVAFRQNETNAGFAAANNAAARCTSAPTLLFLNPDAEPDEGAVDELHRVLWSSDRAGAVGPRLLNSDRSVQTSCVQSFPTIANQALDSNFLRRRLPRARLWGMQPLFAETPEPSPVDVVSGACLMVKRTAFEQVGGFSADYFMYSDDVALCHSLAEHGWLVLHVPCATVVHHGGGSSARAPSNFSARMRRESTLRFLRHTRGNAYATCFRAAMTLSAGMRVLLLLAARLFTAHRQQRDESRRAWAAVLRWSLGRPERKSA